jgi:hypothetical protein
MLRPHGATKASVMEAACIHPHVSRCYAASAREERETAVRGRPTFGSDLCEAWWERFPGCFRSEWRGMTSRLLFMQGLVLYSDSGEEEEEEEEKQHEEDNKHARPHGKEDNDGGCSISKRPRLQLPSAEQLLGDDNSEGACKPLQLLPFPPCTHLPRS